MSPKRTDQNKPPFIPTKLQLVCPFFAILLIHCLAIFLFTRGFLLTRTELSHFSNCSDVSQSPCFDSTSFSSSNQDSNTSKCWTQPSIDRLVIIVFDALRFDFVAPSSFFPEKKPWMDKLQIIQKLAAEMGSSTRIFKAIADPPTTSLQRLKGLTTGGLPTFIDVGNSFGAPAIVEDNFIQQLVENGKRVVMMGDDTWLQLFPHHFDKSFPYPSFNVKDLDTVDNGCIEHLVPSLRDGNWDVLIAHFLGVDHAGHIFGVDTIPMIQKLEQYNKIVEHVLNQGQEGKLIAQVWHPVKQEVVDSLKSQSGSGGLHENTFLVVMGDHGQTLNGDHGGGSPEEVETSIFAMSFNNATISLPPELDSVSCGLNADEKQLCIATIEQLDFAATLSAMLGVPFPFGSIGRVNPQLYALGAGNIPSHGIQMDDHNNSLSVMKWMQHYVNALCVNAWQVKRYIDVYSASSVIGFPSEDLLHVTDMYSLAQDKWLLDVKGSMSNMNESSASLHAIKRQIDMYVQFLDSVVGLARSKWTEFNLKLMAVGLSIIFLSLTVQIVSIKRAGQFYESSLSAKFPQASVALVFSVFAVIIRACSFLSNSYILEEGKVAIFFLGTSAILKLRYSLKITKMVFEAASLILLVTVFRFILEFGLSKQAANSLSVASMLGITQDHPFWISVSLSVPILALFLLAYLLLKYTRKNSCQRIQKHVVYLTIFCYVLIASHWILDTELLNLHATVYHIGRIIIPRVIYGVGISQLVVLVINQLLPRKESLHHQDGLTCQAVAMLSAWSSTIILLSGNQGSIVALATVGAVYCIMRLENLWQVGTDGTSSNISFYCFPTTQWSLLAVALFFCSGHWCAFDGLRYGAAFVGFDEFMLVRQAILLAIDTFGFSHILPIFGLPLLVSQRHSNHQKKRSKLLLSLQLCQVYLMYGCIITAAVACMVLCVTIQRRHLMVWGLFAPKYVFDVVGLILIDVLTCLASLYYVDPVEDESKDN